MRFYAIGLFVIFMFFGVAPKLDASTEPNVKLCNNCYSDSEWTANARFGGVGTHEIYNLESGEVRTYVVDRLEDPEFPTRTILRARLIPSSENAIDNLSESLQIKSEIEEYVNALNGTSEPLSLVSPSAANGCGRPEHISAYAPDWWDLGDACNQHDICYESGRGWQACNEEFEALLDYYILNNMLGSLVELGYKKIPALLETALLKTLADIYVKAVNMSSVFEHYCTIGENSNTVECQYNEPSYIPPGAVYTGQGTSTTAVTGGGQTITATCELWQFPDGNNGYYLMERNCDFDVFWTNP